MSFLLSLTPKVASAESLVTQPRQGQACQMQTGHPGQLRCLLTASLADSLQDLKHRLLGTKPNKSLPRGESLGLGTECSPERISTTTYASLDPTTSEQQTTIYGRMAPYPRPQEGHGTPREGHELQDAEPLGKKA